jgi:hypothetical protein
MFRNSGNYKKFGSKKYSNPENLSIEEITKKLRQFLIDQIYFYPEQVGIKKFKFHRYIDDNSWYEFESVEIFNNTDTSKEKLKSINSFLLKLKK